MANKLSVRELNDGLLRVAGLEHDAGRPGKRECTEKIFQKMMENVATVQQQNAEQEILRTRLKEKRFELNALMAELTQYLSETRESRQTKNAPKILEEVWAY
jgi:ornithine cyclodeaminase/alanine dehydrogenase-like protein (mu-crystallin family)